MSDRKAVNKYYPPDWRPEHGSINTYHNSHPLRDRARKLKSEGILVVRFETPWNMWCLGCDEHIGKGVRYNAQKKKAGKYHTTTIWSFRMKCHLCPQWFEIQNDPANTDFKIISGCRRKVETWEAGPAEGTIKLADEEEKQKLEDPMYRLEHGEADKKRAADTRHVLTRLQEERDSRGKDDYATLSSLRRKFRNEKKARASRDITERQNLLKRPLLPSSTQDEAVIQRTKFARTVTRDHSHIQRASTRTQPLLAHRHSEQAKKHAQKLALLEKAKRLGVRVQSHAADRDASFFPTKTAAQARLSVSAAKKKDNST
eukprot:TRINITY_DN23656_c0_g1_i1.p1 TRINITY_DN23656_c0_g1~~TRINITY_DN23656_c0_g1_i1.p1  ORF type:complete len:315 (+),score=45.30 TRINITY_DN23656_c0_g1_i1:128-1072(+)